MVNKTMTSNEEVQGWSYKCIFYWNIVDIQYYTDFMYTTLWFNSYTHY